MSHTPGPWEWSEDGYLISYDIGIVLGWDSDPGENPDDLDTQAGTVTPEDARLIAAAPDLLAALEGLAGIVGKLQFNGRDAKAVLPKVWAAIAKATGTEVSA